MKTANLTPWCNLFLSASKHNISVKKSRYKALLYIGSIVASALILLIFFTYAYHVALVVAVMTFVLLGFLLTKHRTSDVIVSRFELNSQGLCSFDDTEHYQLQANSRFSFLGCWLVLQPLTAQPLSAVNSIVNDNYTFKATKFFIYRDSLSEQDFSRLSNVISQLNS